MIINRTNRTNRTMRRGITLVEMMMAMALSIGIMLILTESFKMALDFVRGANSTGTMVSQLRGVGAVLSRDLKAEHFLAEDDKPSRGLRLSDQRLDLRNSTGWTAPVGGYFSIQAPATGIEGADGQGFTVHAPAANHILQFTVILPGGKDQDRFSVLSPAPSTPQPPPPAPQPALYSSRAAEVAYFLVATGQTTGGANPQQLYNLHRRYRLVALTDDESQSLRSALGDTEVISVPVPNPTSTVNTLATVATPANRMTITPLTGNRFNEDIVLSNVLSFEVLADWTASGGVVQPTAFASNTEAPFDFLSTALAGGVFDSATTTQAIRIKALQITIRIFDFKLKQSRQNTWTFNM